MELTVHPDAPDRLGRTLLALTFVTGVVDAVSFIGLGHVLTANMTGNVIFMAFAAAGTPGLSLARCGIALLAFLAGAVIGGRLATAAATAGGPRWVSRPVALEAVLLAAAALTSLGAGLEVAVIILTAVAMGARNAAVRKLAVPDMTTTVLTLTLTGIAADSSLAGGTNPRWRTRSVAVLAMFCGAAAGALLVGHSLCVALAVCAAISAVGAWALAA